MQGDIETKTLILVAGPSGAGKSVLINQYREGRLAPELQQLLPGDAQRWPQLGANDCMKRGVGIERVLPKDWRAPGAIAHYDTAYIHRFGLASYQDDPIAPVFERARNLVVVSILPAPHVLNAQFESRLSSLRGKKSASHLFWRDYVRGPVERALNRLRGQNVRATGELYRNAEWLKASYETWETYARGLVAMKPGSRLINLEPCADAEGGQSFRVISVG
jgi:hypothetical protein